MKPPTVTGLSFSKLTYTEGEQAELTVTYTPGMSDLAESSVYEATDMAGRAGMLEITFTVADGRTDPAETTAAGGSTWVKAPGSGSPAVFTATAPGPGSYPVTVTVTDTATGQSATGTVALTVAAPPGAPMRFGCNQNRYADVSPYVGPITIQRSFKALSLGWPVMPTGQACHWSIYPKHDDLLAGTLDAQIKAALHDAPPGSLLTAWHEPELHSGRATGPTMSELADIHNYLFALTHATTGNVLVGPVITAHADAGWCVKDMDFYGVDSYDWAGFADPVKELSDWSARMPPGPRVVAETNTFKPEKRPAWFTGIYQWLAAHGGIAMMTFWNPTGGLSGPFLPGDTATIETLNLIATAAAVPR